MRKVFYVFLLLSLVFLQSCSEEEIPTLVCGTNEENVNGVCELIYEPEELALINTLTNIGEMSNYQMEITIQNGFELYDIIIRFDDEKSSFEFDEQIEYYEVQGGEHFHYIPQGNQYIKETLAESSHGEYDFFKVFEFEWFTYNNGKYLMNMENQADAQVFFEQEFPGSELSGFEMTIESDYIAEMNFYLEVEEINYRFIIEFNNIGTVDIVLPIV